jgi:hypothetical protein
LVLLGFHGREERSTFGIDSVAENLLDVLGFGVEIQIQKSKKMKMWMPYAGRG